MEAVSRKKVWADRSASLIVFVGATFFFSALLDAIDPSTSSVFGLPVQLVGAFGLAMLSVGLGALAVTGYHLALKRNLANGSELRGLVEQHLQTVAQVLGGAALSLLYLLIRN